jgi:hypothetical protein
MQTTVLAIIALVILISTLYFLKDTILEALSGGKSFMPSEMKPFASGRKNKPTNEQQIKQNRTSILIIDLISIALVVFIVYLFLQKYILPNI